MKKILFALVIMFCSQIMFAGDPIKFRLGVMALANNHWMMSSGTGFNLGINKFEYNRQFTYNVNGGFTLGLNFTDAVGVEIDVILGKYKQDYKPTLSGVASEEYTTEITKIDIPLLFKLGGLMYFEVGPQYTIIQEVNNVSESETVDVTEFYASSQLFAVIGTGVGFNIPKIARIETGLRLGYGFQDISLHKDEGGGFIMFNDQTLNQAFWGIKLAVVHEF